MKVVRRLLAVTILSAVVIAPSCAHDWYPQFCCSGTHCHPVDCKEIQDTGTLNNMGRPNLMWKGYGPFNNVEPSQDSGCHVCLDDHMYFKNNPIPTCIFLPKNVTS